jgi:hypothetical protein
MSLTSCPRRTPRADETFLIERRVEAWVRGGDNSPPPHPIPLPQAPEDGRFGGEGRNDLPAIEIRVRVNEEEIRVKHCHFLFFIRAQVTLYRR